MKLEFLVISLMVLLINGDENSATTTFAPSTQSSTTTTVKTTVALTSTEQVSTTIITSTTSIPKVDNSTISVKITSNRTQLLNTTSYACSCDLTLNCDINCCCDMDCSDGILEAFRCDDGVKIDDYRYGEGLEQCKIDNGLFCILHDRLGSPNYYLKAPIHREYSTYRWPQKSSLIGLEPRRRNDHDFYKYGDDISTYNTKSKKRDTIEIPATLTDSTCYLNQPVTFLRSKSVKCLKSLNEICSYNNNLILQLVNSQLFNRPSKLFGTREASAMININIQSCQHTFGNCSKILMNEDVAEELELIGEDFFDEILMEFVINDTSISSLTVKLFSHGNLQCGIGIEEFGQTKLVQKINVRFTNENEGTGKLIRKYSRGYNDEEYIIASRLRPINESHVDGEKVLDYHNEMNPKKRFYMLIPETYKGRCVLNDNTYDLIRFNEHSDIVCTVELARVEKLNETCQQFQRQIIHFLFNTMNLTSNYTKDNFISDVLVSQFWSPRNDLLSWKRVIVKNSPAWNPEQRETENFLICANIAKHIQYSFYSSKVRSTTARKYENLIEKLIVQFGYAEEIKFPKDDENSTAKMSISIKVQFFNLHDKIINNNSSRVLLVDFLTIMYCIAFCLFRLIREF